MSVILPNGTTKRQPLEALLAAIYARVSTTDQADHGYSLPTQIAACHTLAQQRGYTVPESYVFADDYTGTSLKRPQLTRLRELVQQQLIQAVIVYDLDRLSRKLAHQLLLTEEVEQAGVALLVCTMLDNGKTPETQLLANVRGIIAEYEREKLLERTSRGRRGRIQAGNVPHGRRTLGYVYVPKQGDALAHYQVHPEEAAIVQRIFYLYVEKGYARDAIAALLTTEHVPTYRDRTRKPTLGVWHGSSIGAILRNTAYVGTVYEGKTHNVPSKLDPDKKTRHRHVPKEEWIAVTTVPPIIDQATFDAAQALLVQNRVQSKRNRKHEYLFVNGRLRCGQCGCAMYGLLNSKGYAGYRCGRARFLNVITHHTRRHVQASAIEPGIWAAVERALRDPELIAAAVKKSREDASHQQGDLARERQQYERQIAQCEKDLKRWEAAYLAEAIDVEDFRAKRAELAARRTSAVQELTRLDEQQRLLEEADMELTFVKEYSTRIGSDVENPTMDKKRRALDALGITVFWRPG